MVIIDICFTYILQHFILNVIDQTGYLASEMGGHDFDFKIKIMIWFLF